MSAKWPIQRLVFFIAQETSEEMVSLLRQFVISLEERRNWLVAAPYVIDLDDVDGCCVQVAGVLEIYSAIAAQKLPVDIDAIHFDEVKALVAEIEEFSHAHNLEFEIELDGELVGAIANGEPDGALRAGLLSEWETLLNRWRCS